MVKSCSSTTLNNIKKKTSELSTLCSVDVCILSFSADGREVETWPENPNQLKPILRRYKEHRSSKLLNSSNNKSGVGGTTDQFRRRTSPRPPCSWNRDSILSLVNGLSSNSLKIFSDQIAAKLHIINSKMEFLKSQQQQSFSNLYNSENNAGYQLFTPDPQPPAASHFYSDDIYSDEIISLIDDLPIVSETICVPPVVSDDLPSLPWAEDIINGGWQMQMDQHLNFNPQVPSSSNTAGDIINGDWQMQMDQHLNFNPQVPSSSNTIINQASSDWLLSSLCSDDHMQFAPPAQQSQQLSALMDEFLRECF
ncbi:uncharacterized protein LOC124909685 [Impatiens glandulifera]|uniref:uncharacterized protein LOC124909685 n=1 Tax=Impatiens glandulifera TaxID=253017 RepID=UPI001FB19F66|nr:uncharacterized protein LOC124909685 [Impatiens glandulifera]